MVSFRFASMAAALLIVGASAHKGHVHETYPPTTTTVAPPKYGHYGKYGKYMKPTASPTKTYPTKSYPEKCTAPKDRCAGAPGKPYVEYIGCCGDNHCLTAPEMGWGRFCLPKKPSYGYEGAEPKCHKLGERCMGAKGYEYVEYLGCCGGASCEEDPSMGWGSFCKPGKYYDYGAHPTEAPKYYHKPTAAPEKKKYDHYYHYPTTTMAPMKKSYGSDHYYGYGKKDGKAHAAPSASTAFAAFGENFGCAFEGAGFVPPVAANEQTPVSEVEDGEVAIFQTITIVPPADNPTCTISASTVPAEDAQAILDSLCATANAASTSTVTCTFISIVDAGTSRMLDVGMDAVMRQAGSEVDLTYEFLMDASDAAAVIGALNGVIPPGSDPPSIVAPESAPTTAPVTTAATTTASTVPMESMEE